MCCFPLNNDESYVKPRIDTMRQKKYLVVMFCYKHFEPNGSIMHKLNEPLGSKCLQQALSLAFFP